MRQVRPVRTPLVLAGALLLGAPPASAAPCAAIDERDRQITQEQLESTKRALDDGVITGQEADEAEVCWEEIAKSTEELGERINGDRVSSDSFGLSWETFRTAGGLSAEDRPGDEPAGHGDDRLAA